MRKCNWFTGHCLHRVDGTERKKKRSKKKVCAHQDDYVYERFWGDCIDIEVVGKCCWCGKTEVMNLSDFDVRRAMQYPDVEVKP